MKQSKPFRTGELSAIMRAIHQTADEEPRILADPVAPRLLDIMCKDDAWIASFLEHPFAKAWRAGFLVRNRYAEDCLEEGVEQGLRQYVILGAGLDTFAFRQPPWASSLCVYEVDLPATQRWKCELLAAAGIPIPANLRFVPIDFEKTSLADALRAANFEFGSGTFCSWLGVTQYLTEKAIRGTLEFVLTLPHHSEIVFSFILPPEAVPDVEAQALLTAARKAAEIGEPWLSTFRPGELKALLRAMGFSGVVHLTPEEVHNRYFQSRRDGLKARHGEQLMRAIV